MQLGTTQLSSYILVMWTPKRASKRVCSPARSAVPMFLSTKLMPRGDSDFAKNNDEPEDVAETRNHMETVEHFNESVDDMTSFFNDSIAADDVLQKLVSVSGHTR